jgi:uncharacterized protein YjeT (DUF2065 family)
MDTIFLALGLVLIIEGLVWTLAPSFLEQMLEMLRTLTIPDRRMMGLLAVTFGMILLWVAHALGA